MSSYLNMYRHTLDRCSQARSRHLKVYDDQEDDDGGHQLQDVGQAVPVEGLLQRTHLPHPKHSPLSYPSHCGAHTCGRLSSEPSPHKKSQSPTTPLVRWSWGLYMRRDLPSSKPSTPRHSSHPGAYGMMGDRKKSHLDCKMRAQVNHVSLAADQAM